MSFIDELGKACDKATDGEWFLTKSWGVFCRTLLHVETPTRNYTNPESPTQLPATKDDAKFIALANPQIVRWLLDVMEDMKDCIETEQIMNKRNGWSTYYHDNLLKRLSQGPTPQTKEVK